MLMNHAISFKDLDHNKNTASIKSTMLLITIKNQRYKMHNVSES